jgi:hypothetical protein
MSRPYVRLVNVDEVNSTPWSLDGFAAASTRPLSTDQESGASTSLLELPAGWTAPSGAFTAGIELLVIDGMVQIGEFALKRLSYSYIPPGIGVGPWSAASPTHVLWMPAGTLAFAPGTQSSGGTRPSDWVPQLDTSALPWQPTVTAGFPTGAMRKTLRIDPVNGASTWLLGMLPQVRDTRQEIHPTAEEGFILLGESKSERGVGRPGSYFWRPAFIPHGPFSTDVGVLELFRTDGPLRTDYVWPEP